MTKFFAVKATGTYVGGFDVPDAAAALRAQGFDPAALEEVAAAPDHALQKRAAGAWGAKPANQAAIDAALPGYAAELDAERAKVPK